MLKLAGTVIALIIVLCGCAPPRSEYVHTKSRFELFIPKGAESYELETNQKIVLGEPITQPTPAYPPDLIDARIARRTVCLEIEIDETGIAYTSRPLYGIAHCPLNVGAVEPAFVKTAKRAVAQWRFVPAILCTFPAHTDVWEKGNDCAAEGARVTPIAIKLAFVFTFVQTRGVTNVRTDDLVP